MRRSLVPILLLAATLHGHAGAQDAPQPLVRFPGSDWRLTPPPGFALSTTPTAGIRHPNGAVLTLVQFPRQALTRASFGAVGAITAGGTEDEGRLESVEQVMAGGRPAFLVSARMTQRGALAHSLIVEGDRNNAGVTLTVPDSAGDFDRAAIRAALLSVTDKAAVAAPPIPQAGVRFPGTSWSIAPPQGFALVTTPATMFRHPDGSFIIMIEGPRERLNLRDIGAIGSITAAGTPNEGRLEAAEQLTAKGRPAILMRLRMPRRALVNHTLVIEGEHGNVSVSLAIPDRVAGSDPAAIRAALLSTAETPRSADQRLGDVPFRLTDMAGMRVAHIIANSIVVLTDGPRNQMDEGTEQSFAMISQFPKRPGEQFDAARDVTKVAAQIRQQYPNATILAQTVERTAKGPVAAVTYRRTPPGANAPVAGAAWAWESGGNFMFFIAQHPTNKPEQATRLAKVRDGVTPK
jgi:hypothetical protein